MVLIRGYRKRDWMKQRKLIAWRAELKASKIIWFVPKRGWVQSCWFEMVNTAPTLKCINCFLKIGESISHCETQPVGKVFWHSWSNQSDSFAKMQKDRSRGTRPLWWNVNYLKTGSAFIEENKNLLPISAAVTLTKKVTNPQCISETYVCD